MFYVGFVGGADAKAFISIAALMPLYPEGLTPLFGVASIFFPLSVLTNSVIFSASSVLLMLLWNLTVRIGSNEKFFLDLEKESWWKKLLILMTSAPMDLGYLKRHSSKYSLAENLVQQKEGGFKRRLKVVYRVSEYESIEEELKPYLDNCFEGKIWASPLLPMMVFITAGILCTLFIGDIAIIVVTRIIYFI